MNCSCVTNQHSTAETAWKAALAVKNTLPNCSVSGGKPVESSCSRPRYWKETLYALIKRCLLVMKFAQQQSYDTNHITCCHGTSCSHPATCLLTTTTKSWRLQPNGPNCNALRSSQAPLLPATNFQLSLLWRTVQRLHLLCNCNSNAPQSQLYRAIGHPIYGTATALVNHSSWHTSSAVYLSDASSVSRSMMSVAICRI